MIKKTLLSIVVCLMVCNYAQAQETQLLEINGKKIQRCGMDSVMAVLFQDPVFQKNFLKNQKEAREKIKHQTEVACGSPILIPVAVHYAGGVTTANEQCLIDKANEQIQVMNEDFGGYNADIFKYCDFSTACPSDYPPNALGGGACIEFCLADTGHPCDLGSLVQGKAITVGVYSSSSAPCWSGYLNFFVRNLGGGLLGFAPLNGANNPNGNGITITTSSFGGLGGPCSSGVTLDNSGVYNLGRTGTHEAGHYFDLEHVFDGCGGGDGIADTPPQSQENFGCPTINTSNCTSTSGNSCGTPDFWFNYMDYVNDACMYMFTELQCVAMNNSASPASKWAQGKCSSPGTYNPTYPNGCASTPTMTATVVGTTDVICNGDATGEIIINIIDGTPPYNVFANATPYGNVTTITGLIAGAYTISVNDAAGMSYTIPGVTIITEPLPIIPVITAFINPTCFGDTDGSINAIGTGGQPPYEYSLDNLMYQPTGIFTGLAADNYLVYVRDAFGCIKTVSQTLTSPSEITINEINNNAPLCFGSMDGSLEVEAIDGSGGYTYELVATSETNTTGIFSGLADGIHTISVIDNNSCTASAEFTLTEPDELSFIAISSTVISCFGDATGVLDVEAGGGTGPYGYEISGIEMNTDGLFENLPMGIYTVIITDDNNCTYMEDFTLSEPTEVILEAIEIIPVTCGGNTDGAVTLSTSGGVPGYQYSNDGANYQASPSFTNLSGGLMTFYVIDDNGCIKELAVDIMESSTLSLSVVDQVNVECIGDFSGSTTVTATGGSGTITYTLDAATNTTGIFTGLTAGSYTITAVDMSNCPSSFMVEILANSDLSLNTSGTSNITCFGADDGTFSVTGSGGSGGYQYSLDGINFDDNNFFSDLLAGPGTVYVMDASGCQATLDFDITEPEALELELIMSADETCFGYADGSVEIQATGGTGALSIELGGMTNSSGNFNGLEANSYLVVVTDDNNCTHSITVMIDSPSEITYTLSNEVNSNCDNDPIGGFTISANGGAGNYTYEIGATSNTTGVFNNLPTGAYEVMITDINNCTSLADANVSSGADIVASIDASGTDDPECNNDTNGSILVIASGGTGTLSYQLNAVQNNTGLFIDLPAGNYVVTVTDAVGCSQELPYELINPDAIQITTLDLTDLNCANGNDGAASFSASGGSGNLSYNLSNTAMNTTGIFTGLSPDNYILTVTDENDCESTSTFSITAPDPLDGNIIDITDVSCFGDTDGQVEITGTGGSGNYTYIYNGASFNSGLVTGLPAGMVTITVQDDNNCQSDLMVEIGTPDEITVTLIEKTDAPCLGIAEGSISVQAQGGTGNLNYTLEGQNNTTGIFTALDAGTFTMTITDQNNCIQTYDFNIEEGLNLELEGNSTPDTGMSTGTINLNTIGGTAPFTYSLNNGAGQNSSEFNNLTFGSYEAQVEDANGCIAILTIEVEERPTLIDWNITEFINGPNPFREQYIFDYYSNGEQIVDFNIYSYDGKLIYTVSQEAIFGTNRMVFDFDNGLKNLVQGCYILHMQGKRVSKAFRIVRM